MKARFIVLGIVLVCVLAIVGQIAKAAPPASRAIDHDPVFSPDGKTLAFVRTSGGTGRIYALDMRTRKLRVLTPPQPLPYWITWAPDGSALAYAADGQIWRVVLGNGALLQLTHDDFRNDEQPSWSPDGTTIAYTRFEGCFRCTALYAIAPDGGSRRVLVPFQQNARNATWSPDATELVDTFGRFYSADGTARGHLDSGSAFQWAPDGTRLVWRSGGYVYVGAADGSRSRRLAGNAHATALLPAWSRSGTRIAFGLDGHLAVTDLSGHWGRLAPANVANDRPSWAPNGTIAYVEPSRCGIDAILADGTHHTRLTHAC